MQGQLICWLCVSFCVYLLSRCIVCCINRAGVLCFIVDCDVWWSCVNCSCSIWLYLTLSTTCFSTLSQARRYRQLLALTEHYITIATFMWRPFLNQNLGPDLQNILQQSYDCLTIMPKLRSTYDRRLIHKTSYEGRKAFLRYSSLAKP